jgi:hypothetical protein
MANITTCDHNAEAQKLVGGRPVPCRKCGCLLEADETAPPGTVRPGNPSTVKPKYPGERKGDGRKG